MMIVKTTLKKSHAIVEQLIEFATKGLDTDGMEVHVKNSASIWRGRGGYRKSNPVVRMSPESEYLATVCIGKDSYFPAGAHPTGAHEIVIQDWKDALVFLTAHEVMHCDQIRGGRAISEVEANKFGVGQLSEWQAIRNNGFEEVKA